MTVKQGLSLLLVLVVLVIAGIAFGAAVSNHQLIGCSTASHTQNTQFYTCIAARTEARFVLEFAGGVIGFIAGVIGIVFFMLIAQPEIETKPVVTV